MANKEEEMETRRERKRAREKERERGQSREENEHNNIYCYFQCDAVELGARIKMGTRSACQCIGAKCGVRSGDSVIKNLTLVVRSRAAPLRCYDRLA